MPRLSAYVLIAALVCSSALAVGDSKSDELLWDVFGVPHIFARDRESALRLFGCAQVQSHGDRLLRMYGRARGRSAEYWGETNLENDRWVRLNGIPARAEEWAAQQTPAFRRALEAFADGINTCAARDADAVSSDLRVVLPVTVVDVLAHAQRVLLFNFVASPRLMQAVAPQPKPTSARVSAIVPPEAASNGWAVSPARTAGGHALLLANPHLSWVTDEATFYEAHLVTPGANMYGATLIGFPVLGIAFNDQLGWTHTVSNVDSADLFQLSTRGDEYVFDGGLRAFETRTETIKVKTAAGTFRETPLIIRRSLHGPIIGERDGHPIALRVAGVDRPAALAQWWDMAAAKSLREFEAIIARQQIPVFTIVYADRDGHILHFFNGHAPARPPGPYRWQEIVPGDSSATLWTAIQPFPQMPLVVDPPSGWLQSTNDPPWSATWPPAKDGNGAWPEEGPRSMGLRTAQSIRLLLAHPRMTLASLIEAKYSTRMELADRVLDDLLAAARGVEKPEVRRGVATLERWDRRADAESRGAVLFEAFGRHWSGSAKGSPFATPWNAAHPIDTPDGLVDADQAVAALARAVVEVEAGYGRADVAWGDVYRYRHGALDLAANGGPGDALGIFTSIRYAGASADPAAKTRSAVFGDSYIAAVEFSSPVRARVLLTYGNASRQDSPHAQDQLSLFGKKELRTAWRTRKEVLAHLARRGTP